jgi:hypothetical protein
MSADKSQGKIGTLKAESPDTLLSYRRHERLFYPVIAMMVHRVLGKQSLAVLKPSSLPPKMALLLGGLSI